MKDFLQTLKNPVTRTGFFLLLITTWSLIWSLDDGGILNHRYFTNQTVFLSFLTLLIWLSPYKNNPWFNYLAALTLVNLVLTGLTFHFILDVDRPITLQGHLSHTVIPIFYLGYYFYAMPGYDLKKFYRLLVHPFLYLLVFLITGPLTGFYPYWFLNIETQGLTGVLIFTLGLMLPGFSLLSMVLLFIKKKLDQLQIVSQR